MWKIQLQCYWQGIVIRRLPGGRAVRAPTGMGFVDLWPLANTIKNEASGVNG